MLEGGKLFGRHRRRAINVHREPHSGVAESKTVGLRRLSEPQALEMAGDNGDDNADVR